LSIANTDVRRVFAIQSELLIVDCRLNTFGMIGEAEASQKVLGSIRSLPARSVSLAEAMDCFAAEDCFARWPLPNFDNSAMDGYAINPCKAGARFRVIGEQAAGEDRQLRVASGEAVRIFTGAPIPAGADAVIMQEDVTRDGNEIVANADVDPGEFIRRRGCDLSEGQKILSKGDRIRSVTLALLASQGFAEVGVGGKVRVSIVSTGDELVKPGETLRPGQIYESNSTLLQALVERCGAVVASAQHSRDDADSLKTALGAGIKNPVLIITGGVSVGEHDLVQSTLRGLGGKIDIWRVAIKPGKPFLFGHVGECAVFGLPGNSVSAFVTFLRFVRPAVLKMMGASDAALELPKIPARLEVDLTNDGDRTHYFRGRLEQGRFQPVGRQESHALFGLSQSTALLRLQPGEKLVSGAMIDVEIWD
jgi:molybdopterin molybdotransferase